MTLSLIWLHVLFLGLILGTKAFFSILEIVNFRYAKRTIREEEEWVNEKLGIDDIDRLLKYMRIKTGFGLLQSIISLVLILGVLYAGLFTAAVEFLHSFNYGTVVEGLLFFVGLTVLGTVINTPFGAFETFVIEELFDFNEQSISLWIVDKIKGLAIGLVFTVLLGGALMYFITLLPDTWWIAGWGMFIAFGLVMQVLYPRVIAPLFNDFDPVEEGELRQAVEEIFDKAGFTCSQIFTMDASKRSSHSNAYFIGFGRTKRVVLFDTLIDQMGLNQIQGVLAHELAHWKKGHIWKGIVRNAIRMGILFGVLYYLVNMQWLYGMWGIESKIVYAGLLLAGLWLNPINQFLTPLENRFSINNEREADDFAADVMGTGQPLIEALYSLTGENLSNPFPHPLYAAFNYTHPPIPDRIRYLKERTEDDQQSEEAEIEE